ncbi:MAG: sensor histidine kinase [Cyclobacteriaceae bacterium]
MLQKRTRWVLAAWWLAWLVIQATAIYLAGFEWQWAFADALISIGVIAVEAYSIITILRYYSPSPKNAVSLLAWSGALSFMATAAIVFALRWIAPDSYDTFVNATWLVRFIFTFFMIGFIALFTWLWFFMQTQQDDRERQAAAEKMARDAELNNLRQQMQPHFLFNSLNSINALIGVDPEKARVMVQNLSDFFRGTLRKDDGLKVTLSEEIKQLNLYLDIEKVRFGHRLKTRYVVDDTCRQLMLPPLLLQPVVENAIKFGLYDTVGEVEITIEVDRVEEDLRVCVMNPYDPQTATPKKGAGFGLASIQRRLHLLYARNDLLTTGQENGIFKTCITIPQYSAHVQSVDH